MNMLADELHNLRNRTSSLKIECQEIKGKFDETSVKISESLSKLQLKVEEQVRCITLRQGCRIEFFEAFFRPKSCHSNLVIIFIVNHEWSNGFQH